MTERKEILHLYHLLMELPREKREEIVVEEFELAHGKEPEGDTERANWYRAAFTRVVKPNWIQKAGDLPQVDYEDILERVQEEVAVHQADGSEVGVMGE